MRLFIIARINLYMQDNEKKIVFLQNFSLHFSHSYANIHLVLAQIAQLVEQRTENPRVTGSIPVLGIHFLKMFLIIEKV